MENIENQFRELLAKQLVGEASDREKVELEAWLEQSEENRAECEQSKKMLSKIDSFYQEKRFDTDAAWKNVHAQFVPTKGTVVSFQKKERRELQHFTSMLRYWWWHFYWGLLDITLVSETRFRLFTAR